MLINYFYGVLAFVGVLVSISYLLGWIFGNFERSYGNFAALFLGFVIATNWKGFLYPVPLPQMDIYVLWFFFALVAWQVILILMAPGNSSLNAAHLRGSFLVSGSQLQGYLYGKDRDKVEAIPQFIKVGEVTIPQTIEAQHFLFSGTTGAGKTQAINKVLGAVRLRGSKALIADAGGGFLSRFYEDGDLIFNPFDGRTVHWSPFCEIKQDYDCMRLAKSIIPDGEGNGKEWHHYAQTFLGETLLAMHHRHEHSTQQLMQYLTVSTSKELSGLLAGTPASILTTEGNDKMLANTRAIISTYMGVWRYLPDYGNFSIRDWVRDENSQNWLYITFKDEQMAMLRLMVASIIDLAIVEGLSLTENDNRDLWFILDEVDSLGKVDSLRAGLTKLRKYGCKVVLGLQTISQLKQTYGQNEAQTLLANIASKLVLRAGDGETGDYFSKEFGDQEIQRVQTSSSNSTSNSKSGESTSNSSSQSEVRETKKTILSSEITSLPDLEGFLKIPSAPIGRVHVVYEQLPIVTDGFMVGTTPSRKVKTADIDLL